MEKLIIQSPAKLNLYLKVTKKLSNGYHELDTSFQLIDIFDTLEFVNSDSTNINVSCSERNINQEDNIIFKAANKLKEITSKKVGINISLKKNIPIGGGLGGGSSNAATTICVLNKLWKLNLSSNELIKIGVKLGADVPLFIKGESSYAKGIGEKLTPKKLISGKFVVISPDIHSSTKEMFNLYDQQKNNKDITNAFAQNDFWQVFIEKNNQVSKFYKKYSQNFDICLSGTGSSMFVKYNDELEKEKIIKIIPSNWRFFFAKPLQYSPLKSLEINGV
jgi:4-diphosphocytidyl-2-C-methyl-D-erythritol kinase